MFFKKNAATFDEGVNILATEANLVTFTSQISDTGIVANEEGKKVVQKGALIDANGTIKNDGTVVGILAETVDVTNGTQPGALIVEGYILKDRLPVTPSQIAITALKNITFR